MKILAIGGDARMGYLAACAARMGIEARVAGQAGAASARIQDAEEADIAILPDLRALDDSQYSHLATHLRREAELYVYSSPEAAEERCGCGRRVVNLLRDEEYVGSNARLTAEGAIVRAGELSRGALLGSNCLILGYGRIGRALRARLQAMEARVTAAARRASVREEAEADGAQSVDIADMEQELRQAEYIFNTVPARVICGQALREIPATAALVDVASAPFGFDLDAALAAGLRATRESGLPGRYCPRAAGRVMLESVLRIHEEVVK